MNEEELIAKVKDLKLIIDPEECNLLRGELNGYLAGLEEDEWEKRLIVSRKKKELLTLYGKVNKMELEIEFTPEFDEWERVKRRLNEVKALRSDLKDRFSVLTNRKAYYH